MAVVNHNSSIKIRRCTLSDLDAILAMQEIVIDDLRMKSEFVENIYIPASHSEIERFLTDDNMCVLGAFVDEEIVAFAVGIFSGYRETVTELLITERMKSILENKRLFWLEICIVLPAYQNQKLQKRLQSELLNVALGADIDYVVVTVSPDNVISLNNLLKDGFRIMDITIYKVEGNAYKRYLMFLKGKSTGT